MLIQRLPCQPLLADWIRSEKLCSQMLDRNKSNSSGEYRIKKERRKYSIANVLAISATTICTTFTATDSVTAVIIISCTRYQLVIRFGPLYYNGSNGDYRLLFDSFRSSLCFRNNNARYVHRNRPVYQD